MQDLRLVKMKIVQINATYGCGSTGNIVKSIDYMLKNEGHESFVAYQKSNELINNGYKIGNIIDRKFHAVWTRIIGKQAYASRLVTNKLIKWIDEQKPDIVHLHNLHSNYINLNMLLTYLDRNKIVTFLTLHDCWFFTGKCFHFVESKCYKWQVDCKKCLRKRKDIPSLFIDNSAKVLSDKKKYFDKMNKLIVVGCSDWICNQARKSILNPHKIYRIYNGIDVNIYRPIESNFKNRYNLRNKHLYLGDANKWLNSENIQIFKLFVEDLLIDEMLILFGCNKSQLEFLKSWKNVIGISYTTNKIHMVELFSSSDIFINLTLADTLPTVNMESISCGTPVITYDSCGSPELVDHGRTGFVIAKFDYESLIKYKEILKREKIFRTQCRNIAKERFDIEANFAEYIKLYKESLE